MANSIRVENLHINGQLPEWVTGSLVPFLNEIPTASANIWPWHDERLVNSLAEETWSMLGRWQARRAVLIDRDKFDRELSGPVVALAATFNKLKVDSLQAVGRLRRDERREWLDAVVLATMRLSEIKPTKSPMPMFGSKILHHFFPSIVPVYDTARVEHGLMKGQEYLDFAATIEEVERSSSDGEAWCSIAEFFEAGVSARSATEQHRLGAAMPFVRYLSFCAQLVETADEDALRACRDVLFQQFTGQPKRRAGEASQIAAKLDAKIAEFCASSAARGPDVAAVTWRVNDPMLSVSYKLVYADRDQPDAVNQGIVLTRPPRA